MVYLRTLRGKIKTRKLASPGPRNVAPGRGRIRKNFYGSFLFYRNQKHETTQPAPPFFEFKTLYFLAHSQGLHLQGLQGHCFPANAVEAKAPNVTRTANRVASNFFMIITPFHKDVSMRKKIDGAGLRRRSER